MTTTTQSPRAIKLSIYAFGVALLASACGETAPVQPERGNYNNGGGLPAGAGAAAPAYDPVTGQPILDNMVVDPFAAGGTPIPCDSGTVVSQNCLECHGSATNWGAPMSLVTHEDFHKPAPSDPSRMVWQVVSERVQDVNRPMPPTGLMPAESMGAFNAWLAAGAPAGAGTDASCTSNPTPDPIVQDPIVALPADAVCHDFLNHGANSPTDTTPHNVAANETYMNFYHDAPWTEPSVMVNYSTIYDRTQVLHHWLFYSTTRTTAAGTIESSIGSHIGDGTQLLAGWAVGGNDVALPAGVGSRLPPPGSKLMIEWHFYNTTGAPVPDRSGARICVVPTSSIDPQKVAGITWLGTENFNGPFGMPAGVESKFQGTCNPSRSGTVGDEPITIFSFLPHMHTIGTHMESVVNRANGQKEMVFSEPFQFDRQISYDVNPNIQLFPGDTITSTCTFFNNTSGSVAFGPSTDQEMCYQFTFSYPAGALDNGVASLVGATNTCW